MTASTLSRRVSEFIGVALFAAALLSLVSLASYSASDPVWFFNTGADLPPANFAGRIGAFVAELSYQLLGYSAYLIPLLLVVLGWHQFWCRSMDAAYTKLIGAGLLFACVSAFLSLAFETLDVSGKTFRAGGYMGDGVAGILAAYFNRTGSIILILTLLFLGIILSTQFSLGRLFGAIGQLLRDRWAAILGAYRERREERRRDQERQEVLKKHLDKAPAQARADGRLDAKATPGPGLATPPPVVRPVTAGRSARDEENADEADKKKSRTAAMVGAAAAALRAASSKPTPPPATIKRAAPPVEASLPLSDAERSPAERKKGTYVTPPLALLDAPRAEGKIDERELMDGARFLEEKCREFNVEGSVVQIHPGPVVTTYEFKPDAGVKYSKITGLADDLCLAMQAESVLIDRIPGKSTVGIQIPNKNRDLISMRELLESEAYKRSASRLTLALGKTIHGEPFVGDLATMPHLLIAGSTGTGKSVSVNAMLSSILFRSTPDEVRLIMIDPKRLELGMYEEIPHLLTPVVVDPKLAANALRWAVREMEERYKTLAKVGVRNIEQYNRNLKLAQVENKGPVLDGNGIEVKTLPFIVVLIDELADLMMVAGNEVEESICRLAQMARAVGIHLILATQRPSVDVITGLIKANLPGAHLVPGVVEDRLAHDSRRQRRRTAAGQRRHALPAAGVVTVHPAARAVHLRTGERPAGELSAQAGQADLRHQHYRRRQEGGRRSRIREGRPVRRGGAHRRVERSGVDLVSSAAAADRVQPGRAPGRHDGSGRSRLGRVGGGRRQVARSARQSRLL